MERQRRQLEASPLSLPPVLPLFCSGDARPSLPPSLPSLQLEEEEAPHGPVALAAALGSRCKGGARWGGRSCCRAASFLLLAFCIGDGVAPLEPCREQPGGRLFPWQGHNAVAPASTAGQQASPVGKRKRPFD
ncbi:uncharacterized protein LOC134299988 [Anolis carolinensis]|uniref:uncharacterized protein LOC134299988 n=1 Tax=Anolis carolinensis TaxID=28377 RepID=UPI002F2B5AC0